MDIKLFLNCFPEIFKELHIKHDLTCKIKEFQKKRDSNNNNYNNNNMKRIISSVKIFKGEITFYSYGMVERFNSILLYIIFICLFNYFIY